MRRYSAPRPYEQLKELTRGQGSFSQDALHQFIKKLETTKQIPSNVAQELMKLTPHNYIGEATTLAKDVRRQLIGMGIKV